MARGQSTPEGRGIGLEVSDPAQMAALRAWVRQQPGVRTSLAEGTPGAGRLGAADVLSVVAGSTGLLAVVRTLPDFIRSRRSTFRIETTVRGERLTIDATNVEDVLPLLERLLDE
ncbi:hypothetical protein [Streptomyces sp. NPDC020983]|uniref:effector-associated constant component EACC1 n=1 Tax=Streptomyces sp. NPDC020983 TaxID=3365106 RepID=UPI0037BC85A2